MIIMIFGITNVGKTSTGEKLAKKLNYTFYDLDQVIKEKLQTTLEKFMENNPYPYERHKIKGNILKNLIKENNENMIIAVCPIFYARNFNSLLDMENVIGIELQDTEEHIFQRLVFSDTEDNVYRDDAYKEQHKDYYIKDIHEDIIYARRIHKKIKNKYFINNKPVDQVVDDLIVMIGDID